MRKGKWRGDGCGWLWCLPADFTSPERLLTRHTSVIWLQWGRARGSHCYILDWKQLHCCREIFERISRKYWVRDSQKISFPTFTYDRTYHFQWVLPMSQDVLGNFEATMIFCCDIRVYVQMVCCQLTCISLIYWSVINYTSQKWVINFNVPTTLTLQLKQACKYSRYAWGWGSHH